MPFKSPFPNIDIPDVDLLTWLFGSYDAPLSNDPIYLDTEKPDEKYVTMHQYRSLVKRLSAGIKNKLRLKPQDKLLVFSGNNIYFPILLMGIVGAECVFTGANPTYTARELAYQIKDSQAKICLVTPASVPTALEAAKSISFDPKRIYVFDDDIKNSRREEWAKLPIGGHWTDILTERDDFRWRVFTTREETNTTAAINYSSGTTGMPKGVEISHRNFISNCMQVLKMDEQFELDYKPVNLAAIPMYHAYGMNYFVLQAPKQGNRVYIMPKFDFVDYLRCIEKFKVTTLSAVPPIIVGFAKHPAVKKTDLSSVRAIGSGAAPLSADTAVAAETNFNGVYILQGYGLSEVTCAIIVQREDPKITNPKRGTVGFLAPNCEAKLVDESGNELGRNKSGELWVRGPNVMKGYFNKPEATADTITPDGWLKTGDVAYVDDDGYFYIVDRKKELIKTSGLQVAPAELEAVLLEHPEIADAGVIGIKWAHNERPRAYLVRKPGSKVTTEDVLKYMSKAVAKYKQITGGVVWVDMVPKNPSGKILRKILRERAAKEVVDTGDHRAKL
ncbi:S-dihydroxybenzoyltransferase [Dactylella cylindrospora]|nr:S-dihydroxybenzoyltransferase [Dactylella cylindrospora]